MSGFTPGIVFCTCPDRQTAERLAGLIVEEKLAACVNIVDGLTSVYRWEGKTHSDPELLLVIKTSRERFGELSRRIEEEHPYDVPELIFTPVTEGSGAYLEWMRDQLGGG